MPQPISPKPLPGSLPSGSLPSGSLPSGSLPPGSLPPGSLPPGRAPRLPQTLEIGLPSWLGEACDLDRPCPSDEARMKLAVDLARENVLRGTGGPFGAAVFDCANGMVVGVGVNSVVRLANSALHAEMLAIMLAERKLESFSLGTRSDCRFELFSTCEPCTMCMGGICWSGITRIVYGATRQDATAVGFDEGPDIADLHGYLAARGISLLSGFLQAECQSVLQEYARLNGVIYNGHAMPKA